MKRNGAVKTAAFMLAALSFGAVISGCGCKKDIANDFQENKTQTAALLSVQAAVLHSLKDMV